MCTTSNSSEPYKNCSYTATDGSDYVGVSKDFTEQAGFDTRNSLYCLEVVIVDDSIVEQNETFTVILSTSSSHVTLLDSRTTSTITITDTDVEVSVPAVQSVAEDEGTVQVCATLNTSLHAVNITVTLDTSDGTGMCVTLP